MLKYRIKEVMDSDGDLVYTVQRKMLGMWLNVYIKDPYGVPWIFEILFGDPEKFRTFKKAKEWVLRRLNSKTQYYYYPFETNND